MGRNSWQTNRATKLCSSRFFVVSAAPFVDGPDPSAASVVPSAVSALASSFPFADVPDLSVVSAVALGVLFADGPDPSAVSALASAVVPVDALGLFAALVVVSAALSVGEPAPEALVGGGFGRAGVDAAVRTRSGAEGKTARGLDTEVEPGAASGSADGTAVPAECRWALDRSWSFSGHDW